MSGAAPSRATKSESVARKDWKAALKLRGNYTETAMEASRRLRISKMPIADCRFPKSRSPIASRRIEYIKGTRQMVIRNGPSTMGNRPSPIVNRQSAIGNGNPESAITRLCLFLDQGVKTKLYFPRDTPINLEDSTHLGTTITSDEQVRRKTPSYR